MRRRSLSDQAPIPTWSSWVEACRVVLAGNASTTTWVKSGVTYVVPFVVSNLGILTATRRQS